MNTMPEEDKAKPGCFFPTWVSPLLVLYLRQANRSRFLGWSLLGLITIIYIFIPGGDYYDLGQAAWFFALFYTCIVHQLGIVWRFQRDSSSRLMEPLLMTSLGSLRIIKGMWLSRMIVPACLWSFMLGMCGVFYLFGNASLVEVSLMVCTVCICASLTALSLWIGMWNGLVRAGYSVALVCFFPLICVYVSLAAGHESLKEQSDGHVSLLDGHVSLLDFYNGALPAACLTVLAGYLFLVFADGKLLRRRRVTSLAFRKVMVGVLIVPVVLFFFKLSGTLFDVFFFIVSFFLCFCFLGDTVKKGYPLSLSAGKGDAGGEWGLGMFLRPGWECGSLLFLVLAIVSGCLFDAAGFFQHMREGQSLFAGYGMYSLLLACNVLLLVMVIRWRFWWGLLYLLPVILIFMDKVLLNRISPLLETYKLTGAIPLLNLVYYEFGTGVHAANILFILTAGLIYGMKTFGFWRGVSKIKK